MIRDWEANEQEAYDIALNELEAQNNQPALQGIDLLPGSIEYYRVSPPPNLNILTFEPISYGRQPSIGNISALGVNLISDRSKNSEMAFRKRGTGGIGGFSFILQGIYDIEHLIDTSGPSEVPMETYYPPRAVLRYDDAGKPVNPTEMSPTLSNTGYLTSPPLALTTLDAAPSINYTNAKAPISAIRVRVGGIEGYTPEAKSKIEQIAAEIINLTGLDVDVVVGSSPQKVLVHIPGKDPVPPVGYVEEGWIQLGASYNIGRQVQQINVILFAVMLLVSGLYILNTSTMSTLARRARDCYP